MLFETPAGFALFKVLDEGKLSKVEVIGSATSLSSTPVRVRAGMLARGVRFWFAG